MRTRFSYGDNSNAAPIGFNPEPLVGMFALVANKTGKDIALQLLSALIGILR
jgi:hypothetical protein